MPNPSQHIDNLIARFLAGEATVQEKQELTRWMDESEVNHKYFGDIQFVHDTATASHRIVHVNVNKAWEKVKIQMKGSSPQKGNEQRTIKLHAPAWLKVAASVLLASGVALSLYVFQQRTIDKPVEMFAVASIDTTKTLTLNDSSFITLNRNTSIRYAANYGEQERRLTLNGEAFFDVTHIEEVPFIVVANETYIQVLGTSFNVKANENDSIVEVYVRTGEVIFFTASQEGVILTRGEAGIYNRNTQKFERVQLRDPNILSYTNRVFVFYNTTLGEMVQRLSSIHNVRIAIPDTTIRNQTITVTFEDEDIGTILMIVTETLGLDYVYSEGTYIIQNASND